MNTERIEASPTTKSQFGLLKSKRFAPFFWTQFFGAFNDNVFKNALIILTAYSGFKHMPLDSNVLINIASGLFILPFFMFSATAGQLADKYEKSQLIRKIKGAEILIMGGAAMAFYLQSLMLLLILLFLMGAQSSFFGPVKHSIMPQHLSRREIVGGNALVESGSFVSILLGTIAGGVLSQLAHGPLWVGLAVCALAVSGWLVSRRIPAAPSAAAQLKINWNPLTQTWKTVRFAKKRRSIFLAILGIAWFNFLGIAYLTQMPNFTRIVVQGRGSVMTLLLTMFAVGIGIGSLLCEKMSGRKVDLGLVPLGSLGLSVFGLDLIFAYQPPAVEQLMSIRQFLQSAGSLRLLADLMLIGVFGGFYIVPLYAFIQTRTSNDNRARTIAASNILGALFMVLSAVAGAVLLGPLGLSIPTFFLMLASANLLVGLYIFSLMPEFLMRMFLWLVTHTMYRIRHRGLEQIPDEGPAVIVCNHVSFIDWLILAASIRRPVRFVMYASIFRKPVINLFCRAAKAIPISSRREEPATLRKAFMEISQALLNGEVVCIFPEGRLTRTGEIDEFKSGIEAIIRRNPVPVIPMALRGMWGSFFSHANGRPLKRRPRRFWSKIALVAGAPIAPQTVSAQTLQSTVSELRGPYR